VILLSVLALGALLALAIGMKSMTFHEAQPFGRKEMDVNPINPTDSIRDVLNVPLTSQLVLWGTVIMLIMLISVLLSPEGRKRLLRFIFRAAITYWALYALLKRYPNILTELGSRFAPATDATAGASNSLPPPEFIPPQPTSWVTYVMSLVIGAALVFMVWKLYLLWQKQLNAVNRGPSMQKLAGIARSSLHDLASGQDSTDVILNCYFRMSTVVAEKKNLSRRPSMTPNEFAQRLERAGLPGDAVSRLTRLFETVRYGKARSDPKMINEAVACLTAILHSCGETV
jgi:hypothetical protein